MRNVVRKLKKMKKAIIILIMATTGFSSCKQRGKSTPDIVDIETSDSVKNVQNKKSFNDKDIYTKYVYIDSNGKNLIIKNGFPRGGMKYTDRNGDVYNYVVFWTQLINETDNPLELRMDFPVNSYKVPSSLGEYYKVLIPADTMTFEKFPLFLYGLTNLESYFDNNIHKSASLNRTINPKESNGFYIVILGLTEGAHGTMRSQVHTTSIQTYKSGEQPTKVCSFRHLLSDAEKESKGSTAAR